MAGERYSIENFVLDANERTLCRSGQPVHVQPKSLDLLLYLVRHPQQLISREQLLDTLWPNQVVSDSSLARAISEVRKLLDDDAHNPRFLATVHGTGIRFVCPVKRLDDSQTSEFSRMKPWAMPGLALLAVAVLAIAMFRDEVPVSVPDPEPAARESERPTAPGIAQEKPVATDVASLNAERFFRLGMDGFTRRTGPNMVQAFEHFKRALEVNPRHAGAMAAIAIMKMLALPRPHTTGQMLALGGPMLDRALEIDPELGLAHAALGLAKMQDRHYREAEAHLTKAITMDPGLVDAHVWLAIILSSEGRILEAIDAQRTALVRDPTHSSLVGNLSLNLTKAGRRAEALELIQSHAEVDDLRSAMTYPLSAYSYLGGDLAEVVRVHARALDREGIATFSAVSIADSLSRIGLPEVGVLWLRRNLVSCWPRPGIAAEYWRLAHRWDESERLLRTWLAERDLPVHRAPSDIQHHLAVNAIYREDYSEGIEILRWTFAQPGDVLGRQGDFVQPADSAHYLAFALRKTGQEAEALRYLAQVRSQIALRRKAGYRAFAALTLTEARNELLYGNTVAAIDLLRVAVDEGFRGFHALQDDPRWSPLAGNPDYDRVLARIESELESARKELADDGTLERLAELGRQAPSYECRDETLR